MSLFLLFSLFLLPSVPGASVGEDVGSRPQPLFLSPGSAPVHSEDLDKDIRFLWQLDYDAEVVRIEVQMTKDSDLAKGTVGRFTTSRLFPFFLQLRPLVDLFDISFQIGSPSASPTTAI